jgi:hypothetical protein
MLAGLLVSALLLVGCASRMDAPPPERIPPAAASPADVLAALPGVWRINIEASAEALARAQYQPRMATILQQDGEGAMTRQTAPVRERFDPKAFVEARSYWRSALRSRDMRWDISFRPDGTGTHRAVTRTGGPAEDVPFRWRLEGWVLHLDYAPDGPFKSFTTEMRSAEELRYPLPPLGDHVILQRAGRAGR